MTTATWSRVQGDVNDTLTAKLDGVANLSGVTAIQAHVWRTGVSPVTLTASVLNATDRTVTINLGASGGWLATATPAVWYLELQVTSGTTVQTWPADNPAILRIRAQGA